MGPNDHRTLSPGPPTNTENGPGPNAPGDWPTAPTGIVLSRDLFFTEKVRGTAEALGLSMRAAGDPARARALIQSDRPRVIVLDLTAGDLTAPTALADYQRTTGPETWYLAAGPHVQAEALEAARAAGCQVVWPRSRFAAQLPALLKDCFSRPANDGRNESASMPA